MTLKTYTYDALGHRITETAPTANPTELYYSAGWQVIEEDTGASGVTMQSQTVYSPGYPDAVLLRDYDFQGYGYLMITERAYAMQDANFNVTGMVTFHTITHTVGGDVLVGDTNGDGSVNVGDFGAFATFYGRTLAGGDAVGDFNHDGAVNVSDLGTITTYYGDTHSTFTPAWQVGERVAYDAYGTFTVCDARDWTFRTNEYLGWRNFHQGLRIDRNTGNSVSGAWVVGTGLYDDRFRVYSGTLGRAVSVDPSGYPDGPNSYAMYGDNPINLVDPEGLAKKMLQLTTRFNCLIEWFPDQGVGEAKVIMKRTGEEIVRFRYDRTAKVMQEILDHGGSSLKGMSKTIAKEIAPELRAALSKVVQRVGGEYIATRLAERAAERVAGRAAGGAVRRPGTGIGAWFSVLGILSVLNALETPAHAMEISPPDKHEFEFDLTQEVLAADCCPVGYHKHIVTAGETLWDLWRGRTGKGVTWKEAQANAAVDNPGQLTLGDAICAPD